VKGKRWVERERGGEEEGGEEGGYSERFSKIEEGRA
jgi:hypothetical protein